MKPHKPLVLPAHIFDHLAQENTNPAEINAAATRSAQALLHLGRTAEDDSIVQKLIKLTDSYGLEILSALWATAPARTLPGILWRLYSLRAAINSHPRLIADYFTLGQPLAEVSHAIAGVAEPARGPEVVTLADQILTGVFTGDFAIALERTAAFCHVIAAGQKKSSHTLLKTAQDLEAAASLWRANQLH